MDTTLQMYITLVFKGRDPTFVKSLHASGLPPYIESFNQLGDARE